MTTPVAASLLPSGMRFRLPPLQLSTALPLVDIKAVEEWMLQVRACVDRALAGQADTARLDWIFKHAEATLYVPEESPDKHYYLEWWMVRDQDIRITEASSAIEAVDAAMKRKS